MLEQVEDTLLAILYNDLPKNSAGKPVIYDKVITGWNIGERTPQPNTPMITVQASSTQPKEIATATYMVTHSITVSLAAATATSTIGERNILEFVRILYEILLRHRRFWVIEMCPICLKSTLSPEHFTIAHTSILAPFVTQVTSNWASLYYETHAGTDTLPTLENANVAAVAFLALMDAVAAGTTVAGLSASALAVCHASIQGMRRPIRLLDEVKYTDIKPSDGAKETQIYHSAEFTLTGREIYRQVAFGPNNVPTTAWTPST